MSDLHLRSRKAIEAVWRLEAPRLLGGLVRLVRDVSQAEDLAHEALLAALEAWPTSGIPDNPGAWLMTTAKHRGLDQLRRHKMQERKHEQLGHEVVQAFEPEFERPAEDGGDDLLRLMLVACHPVLAKEARVALTLRLLGGLTTQEIARAFVVPEPTIAQRIVRAKRSLSEARVPFEVPQSKALFERVPSILEVIYLVFNEGYAAAAGDDWMRPELCQDAMRLGRVLVGLVPQEAEAHGLVALMELQASRLRARQDKDGVPILLADQNRARWDRMLILHGLSALERAEQLRRPLGPYTLQAAIAGCHARAASANETDWPRIVALYDALVEATQSPVVELNRAVAVAMAFGPSQGLELLDVLSGEGILGDYHYLPAVRGDLLEKLGRAAEARAEFERAAALATNLREKAVLSDRAQKLAPRPSKAELS